MADSVTDLLYGGEVSANKKSVADLAMEHIYLNAFGEPLGSRALSITDLNRIYFGVPPTSSINDWNTNSMGNEPTGFDNMPLPYMWPTNNV